MLKTAILGELWNKNAISLILENGVFVAFIVVVVVVVVAVNGFTAFVKSLTRKNLTQPEELALMVEKWRF